ncbi:MAG: endonuclease domain-containing protein [Casimicrobiaceae bacterium]|nr:endonuclease domain-containing protein [Casimicrobiaceae bacterium]MCX8098599.1 endonuclease domain-containing protein [Casimicrobiaceae bacterium]MDW8312001.1 endonuclease domain-containing protein [Burkholderiales bacterium]
MKTTLYSRRLLQHARNLRQTMTPAELRLWLELLRDHRPRFRRQRPIGPYIVDFYCPAWRLVIEIDGYSHDHEAAYRQDEARRRFLEQHGLRVLRFTNDEVLRNLEGVAHAIEKAAPQRGV